MDYLLSKGKHFTSDEGIAKRIAALDLQAFYFTCGGKVVDDVFLFIKANQTNLLAFHIHQRLRGGKGGFGSMLRSFRVNRSTNQLMCRDLNGRRVATVEEEKKLRQWVQKAAERDKKKLEKKQARVEKLKRGAVKHQFHDPDYMRQKEDILDKTEDAFEHGFENLKKRKADELKMDSSSDSELDLDEYGQPLHKKRKTLTAVLEKDDGKESSDSEDECDPELLQEIQSYFNNKTDKIEPSASEMIQVSVASAKNKDEQVENAPVEFEDIVLEKFQTPEDLKSLGLEHLKQALKVRGLKCGGSLQERADRLFSIRNLDPSNYPKIILASKK